MLTLKVNIRAQEERERREKERLAREAVTKTQVAKGPPERARKRKGLNFHQPGTFIAQGEQLRKKAKLEALQRKIAERAAKTGVTDAVKLATLTTSNVAAAAAASSSSASNLPVQQPEEPVPDVEWWDKLLLRDRPLEEVILRLSQEGARPEEIFVGITNLVEHPPIKKPPGADDSSAQVPIFLTKAERKKLRRQNRKNAEMEKQEKIKLGLLPKPEPRLKRSNIMYTLGNTSIANPSMTEQMVRNQEEQRLQAHLDHNESKKLTLEEKRAKKLRKVKEDLSVTGAYATVYRVLDMSSQAHKFKVIQNAKQLTMTGVLVLFKDINLVVVEGGPKQQRKFKHLMLDRINWNASPADEAAAGNTESTPTNTTTTPTNNPATTCNRCQLVWEGQVSDRSFRGFKVRPVTSEPEARTLFKEANVENYWDLAYKMSILESLDNK